MSSSSSSSSCGASSPPSAPRRTRHRRFLGFALPPFRRRAYRAARCSLPPTPAAAAAADADAAALFLSARCALKCIFNAGGAPARRAARKMREISREICSCTLSTNDGGGVMIFRYFALLGSAYPARAVAMDTRSTFGMDEKGYVNVSGPLMIDALFIYPPPDEVKKHRELLPRRCT